MEFDTYGTYFTRIKEEKMEIAWVDDYQLKPQVATITNLAAAEGANKSTNVRHFLCEEDGESWQGEPICPKCGKVTLPYMSTRPKTQETTELFDPMLNALDDLIMYAQFRGEDPLAAFQDLAEKYRTGAIPDSEDVEKLEEFARYDSEQKRTVQGQLDEALEWYIEMWGDSEPPAPTEPETANV